MARAFLETCYKRPNIATLITLKTGGFNLQINRDVKNAAMETRLQTPEPNRAAAKQCYLIVYKTFPMRISGLLLRASIRVLSAD